MDKSVDFILKTSVRFFRNVSGVPFVSRFSEEDAEDIDYNVKMVCDSEWGEDNYEALSINSMDKSDILYWCDQNCCNVGTNATKYERMAFADFLDCVSIVTNESEHILVQSMSDGLDIDNAYSKACNMVNALSYRIPFADNDEVGFVTANPLCAGTALKAGVLIHLPALSFTSELNNVICKLKSMGVCLKGFYSDGKQSYGSLYQLANMYTLGITEDETIQAVKSATEYVVAAESESRDALIGSNRRFVYDIVWRSIGSMAVSWKMEMREFMTNLSNIRLGAEYGILDIDTEFLNEMFMHGQNGYINRYMQRNSINNENIDYVRARIMREEAAPVLKRLI